jgi:hypothetical protein
MMAAGHATVDLRQPDLVCKEIVSTSFSFYDAEEARRISVKAGLVDTFHVSRDVILFCKSSANR